MPGLPLGPSLKLEGGGNDWICKPSDLDGFTKVDLQ